MLSMVQSPGKCPEQVKPWAWTVDPYRALRGEGVGHTAQLSSTREFDPGRHYYVQVVSTAKKKLLLISALHNNDERIMLVTFFGRPGEGLPDFVTDAAEILYCTASAKEVPSAHLIVRLQEGGSVTAVRKDGTAEVFRPIGCTIETEE